MCYVDSNSSQVKLTKYKGGKIKTGKPYNDCKNTRTVTLPIPVMERKAEASVVPNWFCATHS